jgi:hypothetical protein
LEPWCYTPDQIARLDAWQVENLYLKPQKAMMDELKSGDDGRGWVDGAATEELPPREVFVAEMAAEFPDEPLQKWHDDYDRLLFEMGD